MMNSMNFHWRWIQFPKTLDLLFKKKSGIIPIKFEISDGLEEINGFPVLKEYCYLGMVLNGRGSVDG